MEDMVYHGERLEPTTSPSDRRTHPEGRCFFQSRTIPLTTELLSSHPRTSQFDQGQPILLPTTAHQEHHQVHSQGDGTYTVQRLLRDRTPLSNLPIQLTYRTGDMDRRSSSQNRCHTDLLLVAAQRHRSGSSNNITRLEPDDSSTFLTLPVQKTDSAGACVARGHSCICQSARHFQRICPHHAMKRHLDRMLRRFPAQFRLPQGMPLIPNASGHTISQDQLIQVFRDTIQLTGTTIKRPGRVSGAQFLSRLGYSLEAVQLIGRWGSDAIKRYIQEAPLQLQHVANPRAPAPNEMTSQHLRNLVQREVQALQHQYWICNPMTKVCHVPAVPETCIDNARWVTLCGWNYGTSLYRKQMTKPTDHYCAKCKYLANIKEIDLDSEDDSWETLVRTGGWRFYSNISHVTAPTLKQMHLTLTATPQHFVQSG